MTEVSLTCILIHANLHPHKSLIHIRAAVLAAATSKNKNASAKSKNVYIKLKQRHVGGGKKDKDTSSFIRISNFNSRGGAYRKFRVPPTQDLVDDEDDYALGKPGLSDRIDPAELDKLDEDLQLYGQSEQAFHNKVIDEDVRERRRMKIGIIKKKIARLEGRVETNVNLLTWDAKEQIKHLNMIDPETWTPEKIAESFPITVESCRKLLKSKWAPKSLQDVARHDEKVIENWTALKKIKPEIDGGPPINIYKELIESNKMNLMKHAAGLPGIDFERKALKAITSESHFDSLICKTGMFTKIIEQKLPLKTSSPAIKKLEETRLMEAAANSQREEKDQLKSHLSMTKNKLDEVFLKVFTNDIKHKNVKKSKSKDIKYTVKKVVGNFEK